MPAAPYEYAVVGGGLVGLATAYRLLQERPGASLALLEKEARVASHQSTHNSGVLHCGLYYKPGSEKARLCVNGLRQMADFCQEHGIAHEICGKLVVAAKPEELTRLDELERRGAANGLTGVRRIGREEMLEIEPHVGGIAALHVPQEGIVDYRGVADRLQAEVERMGGRIFCGQKVTGLAQQGEKVEVVTSMERFEAGRVVSCAGLHSDRVLQASGARRAARIVPFRGEYFKLAPARQFLVRNLIYPVPDPAFPFLGVHFTRLIGGGIEAGPNAVLAFAREGYRFSAINLRDIADAIFYPGLWRFLVRYPSMAAYEFYRSLSKRSFRDALAQLVPGIEVADLAPGGSGVRAQAMFPDGRLVEDFLFQEQGRILHVLNAPSPAATSSLAIGEAIVNKLLASPR